MRLPTTRIISVSRVFLQAFSVARVTFAAGGSSPCGARIIRFSGYSQAADGHVGAAQIGLCEGDQNGAFLVTHRKVDIADQPCISRAASRLARSSRSFPNESVQQKRHAAVSRFADRHLQVMPE